MLGVRTLNRLSSPQKFMLLVLSSVESARLVACFWIGMFKKKHGLAHDLDEDRDFGEVTPQNVTRFEKRDVQNI